MRQTGRVTLPAAEVASEPMVSLKLFRSNVAVVAEMRTGARSERHSLVPSRTAPALMVNKFVNVLLPPKTMTPVPALMSAPAPLMPTATYNAPMSRYSRARCLSVARIPAALPARVTVSMPSRIAFSTAGSSGVPR